MPPQHSKQELESAFCCFGSLTDWALFPVYMKTDKLGFFRDVAAWQLFWHLHKENSPWDYTFTPHNTTNSINHAVRVAFVESIVSQIGWFSWDEYLQLVYIHSFRTGGNLHELDRKAEDPELWKEEIRSFVFHMETDVVKPFVPVLRKVLDRYLWEEDMRCKYLERVQKRYWNYMNFGGTLVFDETDLQDNGAVDSSGKQRTKNSQDANMISLPQQLQAITTKIFRHQSTIPRRSAYNKQRLGSNEG